jgi:hypothetical protein
MPKHSIIFICFIVLFIELCAQDTLEEIVTWEVNEGINFICANANKDDGDLNNDGYDDFIHISYNSITGEKMFQFYFGSSIPGTQPDLTIPAGPYVNLVPSWGGDLNGNGYNDIVFTENTHSGDAGDIYICFGGEEIDLTPDLVLHGEDYAPDSFNLYFGGHNGGYDFNGDDYNDLLAGASGPDMFWNGQEDIFFGGDEMDNVVDFHIQGAYLEEFGAYSTVGDINGDGYDDLIASRKIDPLNIDDIRFEIYLGGEEMDTIMDFEFEDTFFYESPINCKGDFNGDGFDDVVMSARISPEYEHPYIYLYYGNTNGNLTPTILIDSLSSRCLYYANINNDNYDDIVLRSCIDNINTIDIYYGNNEEDFIKDISIPYSFQNPYSISCNLGDFNGDGEDEILINTGDSDNTATMYGLPGGNDNENNEVGLPALHLTNYPNPFNPSTTISYKLPANVKNPIIEIFNIKGQKVKTLADNQFTPGSHSVVWNGKDESGKPVSSGIYFYKLQVNGKMESMKKCLLLK